MCYVVICCCSFFRNHAICTCIGYFDATRGQRHRNRGGAWGARPPKFWQVPFFRLQSALFFREKNSLKLHFLAKVAFWKLQYMLFPEKCFNFGEKHHICGKFLCISGKFFSCLVKTVVCPEKFFDPQNGTLTNIFLATGGGKGGGRSSKKNF